MRPAAPTDLPIEAVIPQVRQALADVGACVLQAEPGAGKTTLVPLRLLDDPWLAGRRIVMLEPRRLAARAAARRMATLSGERVGRTVGYRTRTDTSVSSATRIEVVTEGILTRRLQRDPELPGVGLVIFDEFHERNLQADLALALAIESRDAFRPDLGMLVMSATIDADRVARLLAPAGSVPTVYAPGRRHEIAVEWAPVDGGAVEPAAVEQVHRLLSARDGDVLLFLPGAAAINRAVTMLRRAVPDSVDVWPLYGALSAEAQDAAVQASPRGRRRVVVATDIAETSLTLDGITAVVDAGLRRELRHDNRTGMNRLVTVATSQASADQRAGRAGRQGPGVAVRLWSPGEHARRPPYAPPELATADLSGFVLDAACWGTSPEDLALLDMPPPAAVDTARALLAALGAIDDAGRVTDLGRAVAQVPVHPRLGAMIVAARAGPDGWMACVAAAVLDERDVLQGRPDELPVDLAERVALVADPSRSHPDLHRRRRDQVRRTALDLARRSSVTTTGPIDTRRLGAVVSMAYPDRVAVARGGRGRFLMRSGGGAEVAVTDPLAGERHLIVADLDGSRGEARVRLAAGVSLDDILERFEHRIELVDETVWDTDRGDLVRRIERRLGALPLSSRMGAVEPGPETTAILLERIAADALAPLGWRDADRLLQARLTLARRRLPDLAPVDDDALLADLEGWLGPHLDDATSLADVRALDVAALLWHRIGWHHRQAIDGLVPATYTAPSGRRLTIDYSRERPTVRGRVQEFFGPAVAPAILEGTLPLTVELLSPADRPVQVTADLQGFWDGAWAAVRKEMAGRYPKHDWPDDPTTAIPRSRR